MKRLDHMKFEARINSKYIACNTFNTFNSTDNQHFSDKRFWNSNKSNNSGYQQKDGIRNMYVRANMNIWLAVIHSSMTLVKPKLRALIGW